ncbi:unnamed protein product [Dovyalis caffra]|uniref:Uncharacterized protein n=1 Tax=Dovyalis caffra TaxID=77055 RepID=A0AAV1RGT5_9ROSI|nr:unnamed protein product [Dovyalis caffra]
MFEGRHHQQHRGPPHGILLAIVVSIVVLAPFIFGDQGEAMTEAFAELLSPMGLLLLPIILLLTIQFLSSGRGSFVSTVFSTGEPDSIHRVSGSPVGVALFLFLILFLLYNRMSIFGGDDDSALVDILVAKTQAWEEDYRILFAYDALVDTLVAKTRAWEEDCGILFAYDGVPLLAMLDEYAMLRQEREEEKQRMSFSFT